MLFRHNADGTVVAARQWNRHGDHPKVRPARPSEAAWSLNPERYGWLEGGGLVVPGDWLVDAAGTARVLREQQFRKDYSPHSETSP